MKPLLGYIMVIENVAESIDLKLIAYMAVSLLRAMVKAESV